MLPPGITRLRDRQKEGETRLYLNGRDSTCPTKGYNAGYLYYPTKSATRLSVIQLISSVIGTPMNILGPVPRFLPRRLVKTRVPAISIYDLKASILACGLERRRNQMPSVSRGNNVEIGLVQTGTSNARTQRNTVLVYTSNHIYSRPRLSQSP